MDDFEKLRLMLCGMIRTDIWDIIRVDTANTKSEFYRLLPWFLWTWSVTLVLYTVARAAFE